MFQNFIDLDIERKNTWKGKKILSFDIDWASDEVLLYTIKLLNTFNIKATFFVTHASHVLEEIRNNPKFEIAIHPNFNKIFDHESNKSVEKVLDEILEIVPEAKICRSHSLTNSGRWNSLYKNKGILFTSNYFMYLKQGIEPIKNINDVIEVPIYFADDALLYLNDYNKQEFSIPNLSSVNSEGIEVFLFHPIHIALNSNSLYHYNKTRYLHHDWGKLMKNQNKDLGIKNYFINLISIPNDK